MINPELENLLLELLDPEPYQRNGGYIEYFEDAYYCRFCGEVLDHDNEFIGHTKGCIIQRLADYVGEHMDKTLPPNAPSIQQLLDEGRGED